MQQDIMAPMTIQKGPVGADFNMADSSPKISFVKPLNSSLTCIHCKKILQKPQQTPCGHRVCEECLDALKKRSPNGVAVCPADGTELVDSEIFHDKFCERDILQLECFCPNSTKGCTWKGEFVNLKNHMSTCEFEMVNCPHNECSVTVEKRHLEDHVTNTCKYRPQRCQDCGEEMTEAALQEHPSKCPSAIIQCHQGCGTSVCRKDISRHVADDCPNTPLECPLHQYGCEFKGSKDDLQLHNSDCLEKHMNIMVECISKSAKQLTMMEGELTQIKSDRDLLENQLDETKQVLALTKQDSKTLQIKTGIIEKHLDQLKNTVKEVKEMQQKPSCSQTENELQAALQTQLSEVVDLVRSQENRINDLTTKQELGALMEPRQGNNYPPNIDQRLARNEKMCTDHEVNISELDFRVKLLETASYDGNFIWKIDDWSRRMREAQLGKVVSLYSAPFYVGRFGYKVCARLYPCGDGIGKGTHISLFFVVMKGENDALLPWPFRQKITFKLIDPNKMNDVTDSFRPDATSSSFQRPKTPMNIASGTPKFVAHRMLDNYVIENTLFIKISVDRTGLVDL